MEELYQGSMDFRRYVDRYCHDYGCTVDEALGHALVREVSKAYRPERKAMGEDYKQHIMGRFLKVE